MSSSNVDAVLLHRGSQPVSSFLLRALVQFELGLRRSEIIKWLELIGQDANVGKESQLIFAEGCLDLVG